MVNIVARNWRIATTASFTVFQQPRRYRYIPSPGTLDQRLFREVTKPIYRQPTLSKQERYLARLEENEKRVSFADIVFVFVTIIRFRKCRWRVLDFIEI